ncbi:MAG: hypothetical protein E6344_11685 [Clostridium sp.]|nr:hypothetical protein [Clostridium sp.]MDU7084348.1 hypothetical protein [Clostridium sp.]
MKKLYTFLDNLLKLCSSSVKFSVYLKVKATEFFKMNLFIEAKPVADEKEENSMELSDRYK